MLPPIADRPKLATALKEVAAAVEELLQGGLTTASESTRQTLAVALQEAARFRLLRLGSTLRGASEELGRFTKGDASFSRRRLTFFLNRAWLLSRGITHAIETKDDREYDRLSWSPPTRPLPPVELVCVGVVKKVAPGAFAAFDFRLRAVQDAGPIEASRKLSWSAVFPLRPGAEMPAEAFLHLPQKQKFTPQLLLERAAFTITGAALAEDEAGNGRLVLSDASIVAAGPPFSDWKRFLVWSPRAAAERVAGHQPGPLDLDTEMQEEIVLSDYEILAAEEGDEPGQLVVPVSAGGLELRAVVGPDPEGKALRAAIVTLRETPRSSRPPLLGLMHYERSRLVLQPLATFPESGPDYLTISKEAVNKADLLKGLSFR